MAAPAAACVPADALEGSRIVDPAGHALGQLEDVVIDVTQGRVAYALVAPSGAGDRLVPVPWGALSRDAAGDRFVLALDAAGFARAPAFARDQWPPMADAAWARELHGHYGAPPYWGR